MIFSNEMKLTSGKVWLLFKSNTRYRYDPSVELAIFPVANEILDKLESILTIPNMHVFDDGYVKRAIYLARETNQSYPDAYIAVVSQEKKIGVISFNEKHFSKLGVELYPLENQ